MDPATRQRTEIVGGRRRLMGFSMDAGETTLAYVATSLAKPTELFLANADGSGERKVTGFNDKLVEEVAFSDGERFTYPWPPRGRSGRTARRRPRWGASRWGRRGGARRGRRSSGRRGSRSRPRGPSAPIGPRRLPAERLLGLAWEHDFEKLSGGRTRGDEDTRSHYRKGTAGDWRHHFTPSLVAAFKARFPGLVSDLGYERDEAWGLETSERRS